LSGLGGPGHTGGEVGPIIDIPQGNQLVTQPAVWINPADSSTWVFIVNNSGSSAFKLVVDGTGTPSLSLQWTNPTRSTTPLIANGVLYLASGQRLGAYDPTTGVFVWRDLTLVSIHWQT